MANLREMTPKEIARYIRAHPAVAKDTKCPLLSCWHPHEWHIATHGASQTTQKAEWRCGTREMGGCPPVSP